MSANNDQGQHYDIQAGLSLFHHRVDNRTTLDGDEKSNDQPPVRKDSTTTAPPTPPTKSTPPSNIKLVGSHRLFIPIKK
ncbi:hypothetical protein I4U23_027799 [Adineta vaga]|nr:hypothetical protein I4U23_027799 [Adineta vaga]